MRNDASIARDAAKQELEKQEKEVYASRKRREIELQKVRKEAEEKKLQHESFQRRMVRQHVRKGMALRERGAGDKEKEGRDFWR